MPLTKKQLRNLESIANDLERGLRYLHSNRILVCVPSHGTTTLDYKRADGKCVYEVNKEYGSELCLISTALRRLNDFAGFVQPSTLTN